MAREDSGAENPTSSQGGTECINTSISIHEQYIQII
jgi:hypothetical protein